MAAMKQVATASIRDLHIRTSELVSEAAAGAVIVIERGGEPVAELRREIPSLNGSCPPQTRALVVEVRVLPVGGVRYARVCM